MRGVRGGSSLPLLLSSPLLLLLLLLLLLPSASPRRCPRLRLVGVSCWGGGCCRGWRCELLLLLLLLLLLEEGADDDVVNEGTAAVSVLV